MKVRFSNLLWGLVFIAIGICYLGNDFNWWNFNLFFQGWWTLFLIIPCLVSIITNGFGVGKLIGLMIGVILLLSEQDIVSSSFINKMIFPMILIFIGVNILSSGRYKNKKQIEDRKSIEGNIDNNFNTDKINLRKDNDTKEKEYTAIFSGLEEKITNELFKGANLLALFGGIDLDIKDAYIENGAKIKAVCIFGGVDVLVPPNIKVKTTSIPIFGGTSNLSPNIIDDDSSVLYVESICIFGGIDIK